MIKYQSEFLTNKVENEGYDLNTSPVSFGAKLHLGSNFGLIWNDYLMDKMFMGSNPNCFLSGNSRDPQYKTTNSSLKLK